MGSWRTRTRFVEDKEETLEIVEPISIMAIDPFFRIMNKISPTVDIKVKQTALTIDGGEEEEAPVPKKECSVCKEVLAHY